MVMFMESFVSLKCAGTGRYVQEMWQLERSKTDFRHDLTKMLDLLEFRDQLSCFPWPKQEFILVFLT